MPSPSDSNGTIDLLTSRKGAAMQPAQRNLHPPNCPMIAVANVISGPADFAPWIAESFAATFDTLDDVYGVQEFHLDRMVRPRKGCIFVSYTLWNTLADFDRWRTSCAFVAAHPDRTKYHNEFRRMRSIRYDLHAGLTTTIDDLRAEVTRRLSSEHPDFIAGRGVFASEIRWTPTTFATRYA